MWAVARPPAIPAEMVADEGHKRVRASRSPGGIGMGGSGMWYGEAGVAGMGSGVRRGRRRWNGGRPSLLT